MIVNVTTLLQNNKFSMYDHSTIDKITLPQKKLSEQCLKYHITQKAFIVNIALNILALDFVMF